jgi:hypothetical protein
MSSDSTSIDKSYLAALREGERSGNVLREYVMRAAWYDPAEHTGRDAGEVLMQRLEIVTGKLTAMAEECGECMGSGIDPHEPKQRCSVCLDIIDVILPRGSTGRRRADE